MKRRVHKEMRGFYLNQPILDVMKNTVLLEAGIPIYGIFHFSEEALEKIITYDMDGRQIQVSFANVSNTSSELPYNSEEEIEEEIRNLRKQETASPRIAMAEEGGLNDFFAHQAALLRKTRAIYQFKVVWNKFHEEN